MGKTKHYELPRAQVAHLQRGPVAALAAILRPLARVRVGRSEWVAASIAGGILVMVGLMLAAFGAANPQGLAERYSAATAADDEQGAGDLDSLCRYGAANAAPCQDLWERAMAGGGIDEWNGHDDWIESQCGWSRECYETALPTRAWRAPLAPVTNGPDDFQQDFSGGHHDGIYPPLARPSISHPGMTTSP